MSRPRASGSQQLPAAVAILAVSIAVLAAVLTRMENGRERRSKNGQQQQQSSNDTTCLSAVTCEIGCCCCSSHVHSPPAAVLRDREILTADRATAAATASTAATLGVGNLGHRGPVQAGASCAGGGGASGSCCCCARREEQTATAAAPAAAASNTVGAPLPQPAQPGALFSSRDAPERGVAGAAAVEAGGKAAASSSNGRRLELLVHNVSHKDMVLSLRRTRLGARPRLYGEPGYPIDAPDTALARPKFSLFKPSSELILNKLMEMRAAGRSEPPPAVCEVYRRSESGSPEPSSPLQDRGDVDADSGSGGGGDRNMNEVDGGVGSGSDNTDTNHRQRRRRRLSIGFDFGDTPIPISDLAGYRVRTEDLDRLAPPGRRITKILQKAMNRRDSSGFFMVGSDGGRGASSLPQDTESGQPGRGKGGEPGARKKEAKGRRKGKEGGNSGGGDVEGEAFISGVYFPLLSVLMPTWMEQLAGSGDVGSAKTVLLVSGVGRPRNQRHREEDNSTEVTAMLMEAFLGRHYPDVRVIRVHSDTNIFRYDDNIRFVKTELLPLLNAERSKMAEKYGGDWQDMMHITMSFADGSPARISSINTALRHFRPSFIHIWELKTFWHERIICEDDVEVHTFEDIDMLPPMPASEVDEPTALIIAEMLRLRGDLERILAAPPRGGVVGGDARDDLAAFWLRKTKKPVLAVLLVQKRGGQPQLYRGTNMEVSMPTGSLCAERNVIGSALAADLTLLRSDIKAVAVLAVARLGRPPTTAAAAPGGVGAAADASFVSSAVGGRSLGAGGLASTGTSVVDSSAPSRVVSPFTLTPALVASPAGGGARGAAGGGGGGGVGGRGAAAPRSSSRRAFSAWAWDAQGVDEVAAADGGKADDEKRLEGVRQALFAVATEASPKDPESNENDGDESNGGSGGGRGARQKTQKEAGEEEETASPQCRASTTRLRSESCADELLAAGRVAPEEAPGCDGGGHGAVAGECEPAPGGVIRSKSFDWGAERGSRKASFAEDFSARKIPRGTKVVRSIGAVRSPGSAGMGRGGGGGGGGGVSGDVRDERTGRGGGNSGGNRGGEGRGGGRGGSNRSSIVAHVPAEPLCSNPLKPCGACMEWLKKIAEVNPDFKVITFTDSLCSGVYIEDVAQIL